jgi:hypothetical protein
LLQGLIQSHSLFINHLLHGGLGGRRLLVSALVQGRQLFDSRPGIELQESEQPQQREDDQGYRPGDAL